MASERDYPLFTLPKGPIAPGTREILTRLIDDFEPLPFEAARKAKAWLETSVDSGALAFEVPLGFSEDSRRLLGFCALTEEEVKVAPGDVPIMEVRGTIDDRNATLQKAVKLVWIARSAESDPGFGNQLFNHSLVVAHEAGACALMVEPYDDETRDRLWIEHFHLWKPRVGSPDWTCLWYPLGTPPQVNFC